MQVLSFHECLESGEARGGTLSTGKILPGTNSELSFCPSTHGSPCLSYRQDVAPSELLCKPFPQTGQGSLWRWGEALLLLHTHTRNEEPAENYGQMAIVCSHCSLPSTLGTHILVWKKKNLDEAYLSNDKWQRIEQNSCVSPGDDQHTFLNRCFWF